MQHQEVKFDPNHVSPLFLSILTKDTLPTDGIYTAKIKPENDMKFLNPLEISITLRKQIPL